MRPAAGAEAVAQAYAHCEAVTRREAANFYYGIRLLARERRRAISAVYAFARRVDDIGDGALPRERKLELLEAQNRALAGVEAVPVATHAAAPCAGTTGEGAGDPVMMALADAHRRFPLPPRALGELIAGVRMDVEGVTYEAFDELVLYCRRVAGAIGRVCLAIFGLRDERCLDRAEAERLADELGVAMQLTNILRDVREDAENGRVYLPAEDLRRFEVIGADEQPRAQQLLGRLRAAEQAGAGAPDGAVPALLRFEAERARGCFDRGIELTAMLDRRSAASVLAMAGIYKRLLDRIEARPQEAIGRRMSLPAREKAWVAARGMLGGRI